METQPFLASIINYIPTLNDEFFCEKKSKYQRRIIEIEDDEAPQTANSLDVSQETIDLTRFSTNPQTIDLLEEQNLYKKEIIFLKDDEQNKKEEKKEEKVRWIGRPPPLKKKKRKFIHQYPPYILGFRDIWPPKKYHMELKRQITLSRRQK